MESRKEKTFICAGLKKDAGDGRASSFLSMLQRIPELQHPPTYLLVENVVGFEVSFFPVLFPSCFLRRNRGGLNCEFLPDYPPPSYLLVENVVDFEVSFFPGFSLELSPGCRRGGLLGEFLPGHSSPELSPGRKVGAAK
jgi:hypothetical protein